MGTKNQGRRLDKIEEAPKTRNRNIVTNDELSEQELEEEQERIWRELTQRDRFWRTIR